MEKITIKLNRKEMLNLLVLLNEEKERLKKKLRKFRNTEVATGMVEVWLDEYRDMSNLKGKLKFLNKDENYHFSSEE